MIFFKKNNLYISKNIKNNMKNILNWNEFINESEYSKSDSSILDNSVEVEEEVLEKLDTKADVRNRSKVIFDYDDYDVIDKKQHFELNTIEQGRNALSRLFAFIHKGEVPTWYSGGLKKFKNKIIREVHKSYPSIKITALKEDEE
jgi:uncharacterized membrane protein YgaE (UPF0421/DUF939 family)